MFESQLAMFSGQHSQDSSIALMAKSTTNGSGQASYRGRGNGRYHYGSRPNQRRHHHTPSHAILSLALLMFLLCMVMGTHHHHQLFFATNVIFPTTMLKLYNVHFHTKAMVAEAKSGVNGEFQSSTQWLLDTGATSHMTPHPGTLSEVRPFTTSSKVLVGNGSTLPITHKDSLSISTPYHSLKVNDVLVAPQFATNLFSVKKFSHDNNCIFEFDNVGFSLKDKTTRCKTLSCSSPGPLYTLSESPLVFNSLHHFAFPAIIESSVWHRDFEIKFIQMIKHTSSII
ncbi:hypothetical protein LIER_16863 [Lithospermum erythrorhizon]|uniref:Retrovirus-related Pol polyprotein from transposon TNT 1-94-like beta-barrel domain-containing protein n=1 Tax=Lithospermum erythrorhizon TaxID=34254 RepID=A0AAV3Q9W4_LITER